MCRCRCRCASCVHACVCVCMCMCGCGCVHLCWLQPHRAWPLARTHARTHARTCKCPTALPSCGCALPASSTMRMSQNMCGRPWPSCGGGHGGGGRRPGAGRAGQCWGGRVLAGLVRHAGSAACAARRGSCLAPRGEERGRPAPVRTHTHTHTHTHNTTRTHTRTHTRTRTRTHTNTRTLHTCTPAHTTHHTPHLDGDDLLLCEAVADLGERQRAQRAQLQGRRQRHATHMHTEAHTGTHRHTQAHTGTHSHTQAHTGTHRHT
jgi:hypothetical protein